MTSQRIILSKILKHTFKIYILMLCLVSFSNKVFGQSIASMDLGTTSYAAITTGAATFTSKDANISSLPALSVTSSQQGQAGGAGYVSSKNWTATAVSSSNYWAFTINASSGYQFNVTGLSIYFYMSGTGPNNMSLRSSADGYSSDLATRSGQTGTWNISSLSLANQTTLTFRIYGWGGATAGTCRIGSVSGNEIDVIGTIYASTLPIELLNFSANCLNKKVKLNWSTASEVNNNYFTIERSLNAVNFEPIVTIPAYGNSNSLKNYTFTDENSDAEISYYRLKQTDFNGTSKTFLIESVSCDTKNIDVVVYPNPNTGMFTVKGIEQGAHLTIMDCYGKLIYESVYNSQTETIDLSYLPKGIYSLIVNNITNQKIAIY